MASGNWFVVWFQLPERHASRLYRLRLSGCVGSNPTLSISIRLWAGVFEHGCCVVSQQCEFRESATLRH